MTSAQAGTVLKHIRRLDAMPRAIQQPDAELLGRFAARRDGAAFADLVRRHGPMVLTVCRSVLRHEQDAEDAFQATFLVLARKADSIRERNAVAGWLCEVAHRVAVKAQADTARRRAREQRIPPMPAADPTQEMTLRDLRRALNEELRRLPERYRVPLVLCYLESRSHAEAAAQLGWSKDTFRGRLDRGREHLRRRLAARGIALSAVLCAMAVAPRNLAEGHVDAVVRATSGDAAARASVLAEGVIRVMFTSKIKVATAMLLAASLIGAAVMLTQQVTAGDGPAKSSQAPASKLPTSPTSPATAAKPAAADNLNSSTFSGRVLGPDGKPVAGAKVYLSYFGGYFRYPSSASESATAGPDGRFEFTVSHAKFDDQWGAVVVASAPKFGPGWVDIRAGRNKEGLTIQLVQDDVPIAGQIVDLEGKPIPNVTLTVWQINAAPGENIDPFVEAAQAKKGMVLDLERKHLPRYATALCPKVTTDAEGRFRLTGIGRNRLVRAVIQGPTVATQQICILTRAVKPIDVIYHKGNREYGHPDEMTTYYGADFRLAAGPCQVVEGVVRDVDTKKPIAGVKVRSHSQMIGPSYFRSLDELAQGTTDADGRYRMTGLPTGKGYTIAAIPGKDQPYVAKHVDVPDGIGVKPVTVDIELKRGVWIEGKMTDKVTGKPIKGSVEYFSMYANPNLGDYPGFDGTILQGDRTAGAKEDGSFRIVGLPGPGLICVYYHRDPYLRANEREDEFGTKEKSFRTSPYHLGFTSNYNAIARVNPAKGVESVKCDVTVDPGWTFKGTVLDPDGKPLVGARTYNLNTSRLWDREPMKAAEFTGGFNPRRGYDIVVRHPEKGLVGMAQPPKQDGGAVAVKMQTGANAAGRLVDAAGKPRAGVELELSFRPNKGGGWRDYLPAHIKTDSDGRFRVEALFAGYDFRLKDETGETLVGDGLKNGETKDLGDVRMKRAEE